MPNRRTVLTHVVSMATLSSLFLAGAGSQSVSAQEIIVKNDAVVTNATPPTFVILNDFTTGDQAGARLVMPCDGRIVGVQVGWFGWFPNVIFQSIETALHIYEDGTFPDPGAELATVVNPLLTSHPFLQPTINEYRTLDAELTIPIDIPVVEGEAITVTLEFANPTNVGIGGPNVVRDIDGCTASGNVFYSSVTSTWFDACTLIGGDLVFRLIVVCDVEGACCLPDGSCELLLPNDCAAQGGQFEGQGTDCASVTCVQPDAACCFPASGGCLDLTQVDCDLTGGLWQGFGTDCATFVCFPPGACCLPDGSCTDIGNEIDCNTAGGSFQGVGTTCAGLFCPLPCPADVSQDGNVNVTDLLSLLGKWGTCDAPCPEDIDESGAVNVTDLLALLAAWGACP